MKKCATRHDEAFQIHILGKMRSSTTRSERDAILDVIHNAEEFEYSCVMVRFQNFKIYKAVYKTSNDGQNHLSLQVSFDIEPKWQLGVPHLLVVQ